jgi:hypothetical protein
MVKDLLISYYKATNGKKPKRLLFYRDGVSEGQFAEVSRTEIPQVTCFLQKAILCADRSII